MRIVMKRPDGSLRIIVPARELTAEEHIARARDADPSMAECEHVATTTADALPQDRSFRDAWRYDGKAVAVNMPLAREIHKNHLRAIRAPLLAAADVDMLRAIENDDAVAVAAIKEKKQALRDVTKDPAIAAAATPEELKAAVASVLKE